jgi:hypothetical protein
VNAVQALKAARAAGIRLSIDGDALMLEAAAAPPASMLDLLSLHKAGIVALLRPVNGWSGEDWLAFFDERAGIAEFDGGLPRAEAEARAFACCVVEWLNRNPVRSHPGRCLGCGGAERAHDPLLPSAPKAAAMLGFIRAVRRLGTARGRLTRSPRLRSWEFPNRRSIVTETKTATERRQSELAAMSAEKSANKTVIEDQHEIQDTRRRCRKGCRGDDRASAGHVASDRSGGAVSTRARGRPAQQAPAGSEAVDTP